MSTTLRRFTTLLGLTLVAGAVTFSASAEAESITEAPSPAAPPVTQAAPNFQLPFRCNQTWTASTYDGHFPNQNSIDLGMGPASWGAKVVASENGTVYKIEDVLDPQNGDFYGKAVYIDHGNGWESHYLHIDTTLAAGTPVVRGQLLGTVGKYLAMAPHLHYTQLQNGAAVRIAFNGTLINVHKNAPKDANGNYPTQNLTSANCPTNCVVTPGVNGGSVNCGLGAEVRIVLQCLTADDELKIVPGPMVTAKLASLKTCGNLTLHNLSYQTS